MDLHHVNFLGFSTGINNCVSFYRFGKTATSKSHLISEQFAKNESKQKSSKCDQHHLEVINLMQKQCKFLINVNLSASRRHNV